MPPKPGSSASAPGGNVAAAPAPHAKSRRSCMSTLFCFLLLPLLILVLAIALPLLFKSSQMDPDQPWSLISNVTYADYPSAKHSRYRGADYAPHDRFFFQWWNYLIYDAETHDHWTLLYHTQRFSSDLNQTHPDYATVAVVHKIGPKTVLAGTDAIPLKDVRFSNDFDLVYTKPDGSTPHKMTIIDDDTYNIVAVMQPEDLVTDAADNLPKPTIATRWNLTFHRIHGMYGGIDTEDGNIDRCAIVSTLFGYHSYVTGWIEENGVRKTFGKDGAAGKRYRAYAAGSWGCKLPSGYPEIEYPWTWFWLAIPGDDTLTPPRPEIGMAMGTARFQTNNSVVGDLYGGMTSIGIGDDILTSTFGTLHHNTSLAFELTRGSSDKYLRYYNLTYDQWTKITDQYGTFSIPLIQKYDIETAHYSIQIIFYSKAEQYFRLPVALEHHSSSDDIRDPKTRKLAVFSDFRACGVRTYVRIWKRLESPSEKRKSSEEGKGRQHKLGATRNGGATEFVRGGWDQVIYDGEVTSLNAIEFAYQAPFKDEETYQQFVIPMKFGEEREVKRYA